MKELTTKEFTTTIAKGNVVIDFWAPWCGPCKMMGPQFEEASKNVPGTTFAKVNVDENGDLSGSLGIRGIPTVVFFKDGKEVARHVGYADKHTLETKAKEAFK